MALGAKYPDQEGNEGNEKLKHNSFYINILVYSVFYYPFLHLLYSILFCFIYFDSSISQELKTVLEPARQTRQPFRIVVACRPRLMIYSHFGEPLDESFVFIELLICLDTFFHCFFLL